MVDRQPALQAGLFVDLDARNQSAEIGQFGCRRNLRCAWSSRRSSRTLQDRDVRGLGSFKSGRAVGMGDIIKIVDDDSFGVPAQQFQFCAVAEERRHSDAAEPVKSGLGPLPRIGATDGPGQDRQRCTREEAARDGGEKFHGRLADEADRCGSVVDDAVGDVLRPRVDLLPGMADPRVAIGIEHRQLGGGPRIAADSAAASTVTSSAGRRVPSRGWPLRGRRRCRS